MCNYNCFFYHDLVKKPTPLRKLPSSKCCDLHADVTFLLDASVISTRSFEEMKYFVKALSFTWGNGSSTMKGAVVTFSDQPVISLKHTDNMTLFLNSIYRIPIHLSTEKRIDRAFDFMKKNAYNKKNGVRTGVPKIVVLIVGGPQTTTRDSRHPAIVADELRDLGVHVFAVGVDYGENKNELFNIGKDINNVIETDSYEEFVGDNFVRKTAKSIFDLCKYCSFTQF